jgi:toxin secretion/phage lysis holin
MGVIRKFNKRGDKKLKTQETDSLFTALTGGLVSTVVYLLGGTDNLVNAWAIFMILDWITGFLASATNDEPITWGKMYKGIGKKVAYISFVIMANQMDLISGNHSGFLRDAMIMFVIGIEGLSIKDNAQRMGITAPSFITDLFNKMVGKDKDDDQNNKPKGA